MGGWSGEFCRTLQGSWRVLQVLREACRRLRLTILSKWKPKNGRLRCPGFLLKRCRHSCRYSFHMGSPAISLEYHGDYTKTTSRMPCNYITGKHFWGVRWRSSSGEMLVFENSGTEMWPQMNNRTPSDTRFSGTKDRFLSRDRKKLWDENANDSKFP